MKAREVMTSPVISATGDTPVRDIARTSASKTISARFPSSMAGGAPIGMVSEGDLIGRDETERDARREWWLALLAEGEALSADFLAQLTSRPNASRATSCRSRSSPSARTPIPARSRACLPPIGSSACPWCGTGKWSELSAARICCAACEGRTSSRCQAQEGVVARALEDALAPLRWRFERPRHETEPHAAPTTQPDEASSAAADFRRLVVGLREQGSASPRGTASQRGGAAASRRRRS